MTDAERRARKSEQQRIQRTERLAAGLCRDCGRAADDARLAGFCQGCGDKVRNRRRRKQEERAREKAAALAERQARPDAPSCGHCGSRDLRGAGWVNGRHRYRCAACGRGSYGERRALVDHGECPYCGGRCRLRGVAPSGRQRYRCTACGRANTALRRDYRDLEGGPFPHEVRLYLNARAEQGLARYCRAHGYTMRRALRRIFREASEVPAMPFAACVRGRVIRPKPRKMTPDEVRRWASSRLPDVRPEVSRARLQRGGEAMYRPTVLVVRKVSLTLDDLAFAGLTRTSRSLGKTHQETARLLLERAG